MGFEVAPLQVAYGVPRTTPEARAGYIATLSSAALDMAALPVERTDAWRTALDEVPDGAWSRKG